MSIMNPILIIGSNSFAGSNFCDYLLSKKFNVVGVSRSKEINQIFLKYKHNKNYKKNFLFYKIDINREKDISKLIKIIKVKKIRYIVNFASQGMVAESWLKPWDWYNTNVVSFSKLINKLKDLKIKKFLNFSTPEVYGSTKRNVKENNFFNPTTPYAISRSAQDLNLLAYYKNFNLPVVFTRTANIFGPHQQLYRIVPISIIKAISNKKIRLHGSGKSIRSFIFMDDVSPILYKILRDRKNIGQTYHISTKKFVSIKKLVILILKILKRKKTLIKNVKERDGKDFGYFLDASKIIKEYKWKDKTSLEDGLIKTIHWIKNNLRTIKNLNLDYKHKK
jgi:dTDP-glucose 4,6-dehydratase